MKNRHNKKRAAGGPSGDAAKAVLEDSKSYGLRLPQLLIGSLLLLLLPRVVLFVQLGTALIRWRWQFDYDEGINLNATTQIVQGHNIYTHNGAGGFLSSPYTPFFYLLNAIPARFTGPSFGIGRSISFLSTLAVAMLLLYVILAFAHTYPRDRDAKSSRAPATGRLYGRDLTTWGAGLMAGMLWLSLSPVMVWAAFYKQDMLAIAFGFAGLAWTLHHHTPRAIFISALLFALAFYTKQSALSAAAATLVWLFMRDRRLGLRLLFLLLLFIPMPLLLANSFTQGGIWEHLVGNQALPWSGKHLQWVSSRVWEEYWPLLLCGGISLVGLPLLRAGKDVVVQQRKKLHGKLQQPALHQLQIAAMPDAAISLVAAYTLLGVLSSLVQMGGEGANFNHSLDGLLPICLLVGLALARASTPTWRNGPASRKQRGKDIQIAKGVLFRMGHGSSKSAILLMTCTILLLAQFSFYKDPRSWFYNSWPNRETDAQMQYLSRLVAKTPGDIYSEDLYLLLSNGKRVLYDDPSTLVPLANAGKWDESALVSAINAHKFALILFWDRSPRWTDRGLLAFRRNYHLKSSGIINAYEPLAGSINSDASAMYRYSARPKSPVILSGGQPMRPRAEDARNSK